MKERIRIKDIASKAGVSPGTVDRVLHNRGNVSKKAKAKVLKALDLLDYSPNVLASVLAYNRKWRIAVLMPSGTTDPFWNQPKEGMNRALRVVEDYGLKVEFFHFEENDTDEFQRQADNILLQEFQCVIVTPIFIEHSISFLEKCQEKGISFVLINTFLDLETSNMLCYIGQDSYHSGNLGAKLLAFGLSSGDKAMICHLEESVYDSQHLIDKEKGFKEYFEQHKSLNIDVITGHFADPYNKKGLDDFFTSHLNANPEIKGIFITTSRAFHVANSLQRLRQKGLKLVGFDLIDENLELLQLEKIDFLINQNPYKQGYLSIINVFNFLIRKITPIRLQHLPLDVVLRENFGYYTDSQFDEIPVVI